MPRNYIERYRGEGEGKGEGGDRRRGNSGEDKRREFDPIRDEREQRAAENLRRRSESLDDEIEARSGDENSLQASLDTLYTQYQRIINPDNQTIPSGRNYENTRVHILDSINLYNRRVIDLRLRVDNYNNDVAYHNERILNRGRDEVDYFGSDDVPGEIREMPPSYNDAMRQRTDAMIRENSRYGGGYGSGGYGPYRN